MRNRMLSAILLTVLAGAVSTQALDVAGSLPAEIKIVVRLDMEKLKSVPVIQRVMDDEFGKVATITEQIRSWVGVDLKRVDTIWVGVEKDEHAVFILDGEFDVEYIRSCLLNVETARMVQRPQVPVAALLPDDKKPGKYNLAAVLDDSTIVFGLPELADKYLAVLTGTAAGLDSAAQVQLDALRDSSALLHAMILGLAPEQVAENPVLAHLEMAEITVDSAPDLLLRAAVTVKNADMLESLRLIAEGLVGMYREFDPAQRGDNQLKNTVIDSVVASVEEGRLLLRSRLPEAMINELIEKQVYGN